MTLLELRERVARAGAARGEFRGRPLLIGCGGQKLSGVHRVDEIYLKGGWAVYRKALKERAMGGLGPLAYDVYVVSAEYGIVPVDRRIASYDRVLAERPKKASEVTPASLVPLLRRQALEYGFTEVDVSAGRLYTEALTMAGFTVHRLDPDQRGVGDQNSALGRHLRR